MKDLKDSQNDANGSLTEQAPTELDGHANGTSHGTNGADSVTENTAAAPIVDSGAAGAVQRCSCGRAYEAGRARCVCGRFTIYNRERTNSTRGEQILGTLVQQFPPSNIVEEADRRTLAAAMAQLESMRTGTPAWQRTVQVVKQLSADLVARTTDTEPPKPRTLPDIIATLDQMLTTARTIAAQPTDHIVLEASDAPTTPQPETAPIVTPPVETRCQWCYRTFVDCATLRTERPDLFEILHANSAESIEERRKYNTAVMLKQLGRNR